MREHQVASERWPLLADPSTYCGIQEFFQEKVGHLKQVLREELLKEVQEGTVNNDGADNSAQLEHQLSLLIQELEEVR